MNKPLIHLVILLVLAPWTVPVTAIDRIFENPKAFISRHFAGEPPQATFLYPDVALRKQIKAVLGHDYSRFRIRYWTQAATSVWLLEEIGKELPITVGFAVNHNRLMTTKVLIFRESRGWEVKYDSFAKQFVDARLTASHQLDRKIDGITGATLSVRAVIKLARLALLLDQSVATPQ